MVAVGAAILLPVVLTAFIALGTLFCCCRTFVLLIFDIVEGGVCRQLHCRGRRLDLDFYLGLDACRGRRDVLDFLVGLAVVVLALVA